MISIYAEVIEMIRNENRLLSALVLNILVIVIEAYSFFVNLFIKRNFSLEYFMYYTHISSTVALLASVLICGELTREITNPSKRTRVFFRRIRYVSVCMQALTMLVVLCIILPTDLISGTFSLYRYANVGEYLICPVLSLVSMIVFGDYRGVTKKDAFVALIPSVVYASVMTLFNIFRVVDGPYDFLRVHNQSVFMSAFWAVVIIGGAYAVNRLIMFLSRMVNQKYIKEEE